MADADLQAYPVRTNAASVRALYHTYRHAKAAWDIELYSPATLDDDLPDEVDGPLSDAHGEALEAFMLAPSECIDELTLKLRAYRDEDLQDWHLAKQFTDQLCRDAEHLCRQARS